MESLNRMRQILVSDKTRNRAVRMLRFWRREVRVAVVSCVPLSPLLERQFSLYRDPTYQTLFLQLHLDRFHPCILLLARILLGFVRRNITSTFLSRMDVINKIYCTGSAFWYRWNLAHWRLTDSEEALYASVVSFNKILQISLSETVRNLEQ